MRDDPFIQGMRDAGSEVELFYASRLDVKPWACGQTYCWYDSPGSLASGMTWRRFTPGSRRRTPLSWPPRFSCPCLVRWRTSSTGCVPCLTPPYVSRGTHAGQVPRRRSDPQDRARLHVWVVGEGESGNGGWHRQGACADGRAPRSSGGPGTVQGEGRRSRGP